MLIPVLDEVSTGIHGGAAAMNAANQPRGFLRRLNLPCCVLMVVY
jgi:hypothetical protein